VQPSGSTNIDCRRFEVSTSDTLSITYTTSKLLLLVNTDNLQQSYRMQLIAGLQNGEKFQYRKPKLIIMLIT
jgi:homoserine kinase